MAEHRHDDAWDIVLELLSGAARGGGIQSDNEAEITFGYTVIASAIGELLTRPSVRLTDQLYDRLTRLHPELTAVFACSEAESADPVLNRLAARLSNGTEIDGDVLAKILLTHALDSAAGFEFRDFLAMAPDLAWRAYFGMMADHVVLSERAFANRQQLLGLGPDLANLDIPFESLDLVARIWFLCSYDDGPDKHEIKRHLNRIFRRTLTTVGVQDPSLAATRPKRSRPTIVVPVEKFKSDHAMYRCFAPFIRQLRDDFELVLVCPPGEVDQHSRKLFDRVIGFTWDPAGLRRTVTEITRLRPDMVYYPSVGMNPAIIALANLRLSPIQVATLGHPATTMLDTIDYAVLQEETLRDPDLWSETLLALDFGAFQSERRPDANPVEPIIREYADPVRISVPSAAFKLNPAFMATLKEIGERSQRAVEFHFFPHTRGLKHHRMARQIRAWIPDAKVYQGEHYNVYMANLNRCDLQAISFPFGGTNSTLDALVQGIPIFTLEQDELHSNCDAAMLRHAGAPEWLISRSREDYVETALRLIHRDEARVALSHELLEIDVEERFFDWQYAHNPKHVGELFNWLYQGHEAIQADGRKVWTTEDLGDLEGMIPGNTDLLRDELGVAKPVGAGVVATVEHEVFTPE